MLDAAIGNRGVFGRAIEKVNLGLPLGVFEFINFEAVSISRHATQNKSIAITGSGGLDRGTPGPLTAEKKLKYDLTCSRVLFDLCMMFGKPTSVTDLGALGKAWLVKMRPTVNALRSAGFYLHEGGSYTPSYQHGRRAADITLTNAANKRVQADITYTEPTGDTISGFPIAKTANTGTLGTGVKQLGSRGRRPYDANFTAGKSIYVKVISATAAGAVLVAKVDVASPGDGTGFPGTAYGANQFSVARPLTNTDGWSVVIDSTANLAIGNFGENYEPYEITFGDQALNVLAAGDEFEFPVAMLQLAKVTNPETRLSDYHLIRTMDTVGTPTDIRIDSGTLKLLRPYKEYFSSGKRLPQAIDPSGSVEATVSFQKRLFDRYFRQRNDQDMRFTVYDVYKNPFPIPGSTGLYFEQIEVFLPQCVVETFKSGDIATKDTLRETITLMAEQPDATVTPVNGGFEGNNAVEVNVTTAISPLWLN